MAITVKAEPINRDIELYLREDLSPTARSQVLAELAAEAINDARQTNRGILGREPRTRIVVDGQENVPLASVRPDGVIVAEFELVTDTLRWIAEQLETHSPTKSGRYRKSHVLFADGREVSVDGVIPDAEEFVFVNTTPYARKIELGSSSHAPDGVYQAVATLAQRRFGNVARITFTFRQVLGAERNPAILVKVRS